MNPFFGAMGQQNMGGLMQMAQAFRQFRNSFSGDPRAEVMKLVQSGRLSQGQLDQLQRAAQNMSWLLGGMQ